MIWMLLVLGLLALALREIIRGARYHSAVVVSKATIKSSHHTDPWQTIGAPGGPQYPVSESDDDGFGVSPLGGPYSMKARENCMLCKG